MTGRKDDENDEKMTEDAALWAEMTKDVTPLKGKTAKKPENSTEILAKTQKLLQKPLKTPRLRPKTLSNTPDKQGTEVDSRTFERFRRGRMPIEGRIDLHGMGQEKAQDALEAFIKAAYASGKRCVLVITGKGKPREGREDHETDWLAPRPGILRERVPGWLTDQPLGRFVLKVAPAQSQHGGGGALYVLLRRQR